MKKILFVLIAICLSSFLFAAAYDSAPMLEKYYKEEPLQEGSEEYNYWNATKVSILSYSKGDEVYSWFGHQAILIEYPDAPFFYDWGNINFGSSMIEYGLNYLSGKLWYDCKESFAPVKLSKVENTQRTVHQIYLDLTAEKKRALSFFVQANSDPENRTYLYDNHVDNCATRVRDVYNVLTDGKFKEWAQSKPGLTYRQQTSMVLHQSPAVHWAFDLLMGNSVDLPATAWEEMFLPKNLDKYILEYGQYVQSSDYLMDFRDTDNRPQDYDTPQNCILFGLLAAFILVLVPVLAKVFKKEGLYKGWTFSVDLLFGILGCLMVYVNLFSLTFCYHYNENLFFLNPLLLGCAVLAFSKNKKCKKVKDILHIVLAFLICLLCILKAFIPSLFFQDNLAAIISFLPYLVFVAVCCRNEYNKLKKETDYQE